MTSVVLFVSPSEHRTRGGATAPRPVIEGERLERLRWFADRITACRRSPQQLGGLSVDSLGDDEDSPFSSP